MGDFSGWLNRELDRRGWSRSEAARRGGFSASMFDKVVSGYANPGLEFCRGVSRAFNVPLEDVFREAGILSPKRAPMGIMDRRIRYQVGGITMTDRMVELFEQLSAEDQELIVLLLEKWSGRGLEPRIIGEPTNEDAG